MSDNCIQTSMVFQEKEASSCFVYIQGIYMYILSAYFSILLVIGHTVLVRRLSSTDIQGVYIHMYTFLVCRLFSIRTVNVLTASISQPCSSLLHHSSNRATMVFRRASAWSGISSKSPMANNKISLMHFAFFKLLYHNLNFS